jgi:hypothetical protein
MVGIITVAATRCSPMRAVVVAMLAPDSSGQGGGHRCCERGDEASEGEPAESVTV